MTHELLNLLTHASDCVANEEVIAYPTETLYGLGCDPHSEIAVKKLLRMKNRDWQKGLIIIAANSVQLGDFLSPQWLQWLNTKQPKRPTTYAIPCLQSVPMWLKGNHDSLAVRLTTHEISRKLCELAGPLVSSSANIEGSAPLLNAEKIRAVFQDQISLIVPGLINPKAESSQIIDAVSGDVLR